MRWICISPHLDDAVLSCGGWIHARTSRRQKVEIWTLCAGQAPPGELSPLAQVCHFQWGTTTAEETVRLRRGEDEASAARLGASFRHFDLPDCIYRRTSTGELLYTMDVFTAPDAREQDLPLDIARLLQGALQPGDRLLCPLAIGGHVDHRLVRQAVEALHLPLTYYADIPYRLKDPAALDAAVSGMRARLHRLSRHDLHAWQDAIALHHSQIEVLFENEANMRSAIQAYWAERRGLLLWQKAAS